MRSTPQGDGGSRMRWGGWAAAFLALLAVRVAAEEPVKAPAADERPFVWPQEEKIRDPFTFALVETSPVEGVKAGPTVYEELDKAKTETIARVTALTGAAERAVKGNAYRNALDYCSQGARAIGDFEAGSGLDQRYRNDPAVLTEIARKSAELQPLQNRLAWLKLVADRLLRRADAEAALEKMALKVTGLLVREGKSLAIINGQTVARGERILAGGTAEDAVKVMEILEDRIIVSFRGFRIEVPVLAATLAGR